MTIIETGNLSKNSAHELSLNILIANRFVIRDT